MKKLFIFSLCLSLFSFNSCSSDDEFSSESEEVINNENLSNTESSDTIGQSILTRSSFELEDGVYHILVAGGLNNGIREYRYLSASQDGRKVNLWREDDGSGRQKWKITRNKFNIPGIGATYNIQIVGGVNNNKKFLSFTADGKHACLYEDFESIGTGPMYNGNRQSYLFEIVNGGFAIKNVGSLQTGRCYLSTKKDNSECVGWYDTSSPRERWGFSRIQSIPVHRP